MKKPKKKLAHGVNATGAAGGRVPPPVKLEPPPWEKDEKDAEAQEAAE